MGGRAREMCELYQVVAFRIPGNHDRYMSIDPIDSRSNVPRSFLSLGVSFSSLTTALSLHNEVSTLPGYEKRDTYDLYSL